MDKRKARVAVLVSGGGTNLQAIIDAEREGISYREREENGVYNRNRRRP